MGIFCLPWCPRNTIPVSWASHQNSSILFCRYFNIESIPCAEPQIFFKTSHSFSFACSKSTFMMLRTKALDSSSTTELHVTSSLIRTITSCVNVPGQNTWETSPLAQASCAVNFLPLNNISLAWRDKKLLLVWNVMRQNSSKEKCSKQIRKMPAQFEVVLLQLFQVLIKKRKILAYSRLVHVLLTSTRSVVIEMWMSMING